MDEMQKRFRRQHRQHRLRNLERLFQSGRRTVWPRPIPIVADAADGADGVMQLVLSPMAVISS